MQDGPFAKTISVDYSDDELDAISEAFTRRDIARRERGGDSHDPVRRAQNHTALRGLVARRAISLDGSAAHPRITFLEPHATLLGAFLGATAVATVRRESATAESAESLFVHGDVVVEQTAREGLAIQRMTAHGRGAAPDLLLGKLPDFGSAAATEPQAIELTKRMMSMALTAIAGREEVPGCVPARAANILYARRESGAVTISSRDRGGTRSAQKWVWIDAGEAGLWRVHTDDSPLVRMVTADPAQLCDEIDTAWRAASDSRP